MRELRRGGLPLIVLIELFLFGSDWEDEMEVQRLVWIEVLHGNRVCFVDPSTSSSDDDSDFHAVLCRRLETEKNPFVILLVAYLDSTATHRLIPQYNRHCLQVGRKTVLTLVVAFLGVFNQTWVTHAVVL